MFSTVEKQSFSEVLFILEHLENGLINKIPKELISLLKENADKDYVVNIDISKSLKDADIMEETRSIIAMLYLSYFASSEEAEECKRKMLENEKNVTRKSR